MIRTRESLIVKAATSWLHRSQLELQFFVDRLTDQLIPLVHLGLVAELDRPHGMIDVADIERQRAFAIVVVPVLFPGPYIAQCICLDTTSRLELDHGACRRHGNTRVLVAIKPLEVMVKGCVVTARFHRFGKHQEDRCAATEKTRVRKVPTVMRIPEEWMVSPLIANGGYWARPVIFQVPPILVNE